jgi:hypothetical protein
MQETAKAPTRIYAIFSPVDGKKYGPDCRRALISTAHVPGKPLFFT